ncbi:MAG: PASTA domain-containing protein [Oscillospiraceae bacterium]|nr:PASTA domain-containing protein [Oscillospiraceae bacterium]
MRLQDKLELNKHQQIMDMAWVQKQAVDDFIRDDRERLHKYTEFFSQMALSEPDEIVELLAVFADVNSVDYGIVCFDERLAYSSTRDQAIHLDEAQMEEYHTLTGSGEGDPNGNISDSSGAFTTPPEGAASTIPTLPTLAVIETNAPENSSIAQTTFKPGTTIYIMNDLVGKVFDTVKNTAINDNLTIVPEYVYTDEYDKGIIFDQSIEKGSNYEKGQEVTLKISMGPAKVMIPDFYGLNKKDYFELLNSAGIKYEEKAYETSNTLNDYVAWISMDPGEYIDLEAGEVLSVHVAVNPQSTETTQTTPSETRPTETSPTPWVTTVPPTIPTETTTTTTPPPIVWTEPPLTDEPDIIISDDY